MEDLLSRMDDLKNLSLEELIDLRKDVGTFFGSRSQEYKRVESRITTVRHKEARRESDHHRYSKKVEASGKATPQKRGKPKEEQLSPSAIRNI